MTFVLMHTLGPGKKEDFSPSISNEQPQKLIPLKVGADDLCLGDNYADQKRKVQELLVVFLNLQTYNTITRGFLITAWKAGIGELHRLSS